MIVQLWCYQRSNQWYSNDPTHTWNTQHPPPPLQPQAVHQRGVLHKREHTFPQEAHHTCSTFSPLTHICRAPFSPPSLLPVASGSAGLRVWGHVLEGMVVPAMLGQWWCCELRLISGWEGERRTHEANHHSRNMMRYNIHIH